VSGIRALVIGRPLLHRIFGEAAKSYPNECCGLLVGRSNARADGIDCIVTRVEPSPNVAEAGVRDRFEVDPALRFRLMRELGDGPLQIVGHYHSHPDHPAAPSPRDLEMAFEPELVWLIVAVPKGGKATASAHVVDTETVAAGRTQFREIPIATA
jgi:proteasome lid subunit RPN8/RPN11